MAMSIWRTAAGPDSVDGAGECMEEPMEAGVLEMRLVVTATDYEAAIAFYRDTLRIDRKSVV